MRTVIVGAGIAGLTAGIALARQGADVTVVDRDAGPNGAAGWDRKGVMQFRHPHFFRSVLRMGLLGQLPDVLDAVMAAGAVPFCPPGAPEELTGLRCRREIFERAMREVVAAEPGLRLATGHAERVVIERDRVTGIVVDGATVQADVVVDASGRAGRLSDDLRAPAEGGDCGQAYVSRLYRLLPGAEPGPADAPPGAVAIYPGYFTIVFVHDAGTFSVLIVRASRDRELAQLRNAPAFEAAAAAIPLIAAWTQPGQAEPISDVLPGGGLYNSYRGQLDEADRPAAAGLLFIGDAVCTTNPAAGRGASLAVTQALELVRLVGEYGSDLASCALALDVWCAANIRPWFDDHVYWDASLLSRWSGEDVDLDARIPSDLITAAASVDPRIAARITPYAAMTALPGSLDAVEPLARAVYATGWRPPRPPGPDRDELAELIAGC